MFKKIFYALFSALSGILPVEFKRQITSSKKSGWLRGVLNKTVPPGLSVVTISGGPLKGKKILLDMKNEKSRWLGTYEPELVSAIEKLVEPGMTIYDVGANIGYVSMLLSKAAGEQGKVLAFEPLPENVSRIQHNVQLNSLSNIRVYEYAVIDTNKPVIFYRHQSVGMGKAEGSAGRNDQEYSATLTASGINLDDFIFEKGNPIPQLIKIDIEGGEVLALPGMRRLLREHNPILLLELHGAESEKAAWNELVNHGYNLFQMDNLDEKIESVDDLKWKAYIVGIKRENERNI